MGKSIGFKKIIFFSFFLFFLINESFGQKTLPVYDGINYTVGTLVYDNTNWWCLNPIPVNDVTVVAGSLTYTGLLESIANKIRISGDGDDFVIWFGDRPSGTEIYYSFIFQVTDMAGIGAGTPAHFAGFSNASTAAASIWGCSVIFQIDVSDPTKFNIGHGPRSGYFLWNTVDGTPTGTPVKYSINTPIFVVARYEIIAGTGNDKSSLWINPSSSTFENALPPSANISRDLSGTGISEIDVVNRFYINQDAVSNTPSIDIDEVRIGLTWASVTPKSIATGTDDVLSDKTTATIYPNPVNDLLKVEVKSADISFIEIYNLSGSRVITKKIDQGTTNIDVSSLPKGVYTVSFKGVGVTYNKKFIKK